MNGTENNSETKQGKPGSGGAITADRGGFNELEEVTEIGCVLKEIQGVGDQYQKSNQINSSFFYFCCVYIFPFAVFPFQSKEGAGV